MTRKDFKGGRIGMVEGNSAFAACDGEGGLGSNDRRWNTEGEMLPVGFQIDELFKQNENIPHPPLPEKPSSSKMASISRIY